MLVNIQSWALRVGKGSSIHAMFPQGLDKRRRATVSAQSPEGKLRSCMS